MFNPFPELLTFTLLGYFFLRITVGWILLSSALAHFRQVRSMALDPTPTSKGLTSIFVWFLVIVELSTSGALIIGLYTQFAALAGMSIALSSLWLLKRNRTIAPHRAQHYILIFVVCFSLLLTGAGAFALDLPL
jgi:uncharacterized membrane protein YphA (DoxX/SURF4 family)